MTAFTKTPFHLCTIFSLGFIPLTAQADPLVGYFFDSSLAPSMVAPELEATSITENLLSPAAYNGDFFKLPGSSRTYRGNNLGELEDPVDGTYIEWTVTVAAGETISIDGVTWAAKSRSFLVGPGNEYDSARLRLYWSRDNFAAPISETQAPTTNTQLGDGSWVGSWVTAESNFAPILLDSTDGDPDTDAVTFRLAIWDDSDSASDNLRVDQILVERTLVHASGVYEVAGVENAGFASVFGLEQSGGTLRFEVAEGVNDLLNINGDYDFSGGNIEIALTSLPPLDTPLNIVDYRDDLNGQAPVTFSPSLNDTRLNATIDYGSGNNDQISVEFTGDTEVLTWTGNVNNVWDVNTTANWDDNGASNYFAFDGALFTDAANGGPDITIELASDIAPASLEVDADKNFTFAGSGRLLGGASFEKFGGGSVTFLNDNQLSGELFIDDGEVIVGNGGPSGTIGSGDIFVSNFGTLTFNRDGLLTIPGEIDGDGSALIQFNGPGTVILAADNPTFSDLTINGGTLQIGDGGNSGTLGIGFEVFNDGTLTFNRADTYQVDLDITGTGQLIQDGPGTTILNNETSHTGGTTINAGTLQIGTGIDIPFIGEASIVGPIVNNANLAINFSTDGDFANDISGTGNVRHLSANELRLTGNNTYTGETSVALGTLVLDGSSSLPANSGLAFTSGGGTIRGNNQALNLSSLRSVGAGTGINTITDVTSLDVSGGDLLVGPGAGAPASANLTLDLTSLDSFNYSNPSGLIRIDSFVGGAANFSSQLDLPDSSSLTGQTLVLQSQISGSGGQAQATLNLGTDTTLNADLIQMALSGRDSASIQFRPDLASGSLTLRGANGTGRTSIDIGRRFSSFFATQNITFDLSSDGAVDSTIDALIDELKIGDAAFGNNTTQNALFRMADGTLDANLISLGSLSATESTNTVLNSTFSVNGGTVSANEIRFGSNQSTINPLNATFEHLSGTVLAAQINSGASVEDALGTQVYQLHAGTLANSPGANLLVTDVTLAILGSESKTLDVEAGQLVTFGAGSALRFAYDSSAATSSTLTVEGELLLNGVTLELNDIADETAQLPPATVLTLLDTQNATVTGVFNNASGTPLNDGDTISSGGNIFTISYQPNAITLSPLGVETTAFVYNVDDRLNTGQTLADDNWLGTNNTSWIAGAFEGELYARDTGNTNPFIYRPNDEDFAFEVTSQDMSLQFNLRARLNNNQFSGGLALNDTPVLGIGYSGTQAFIVDGSEQIIQSGNYNPTGDGFVNFTLTLDLATMTANLSGEFDGNSTVLINNALISADAADLIATDSIFATSNSRFTGPSRWELITTSPEGSGGGPSPYEAWAAGFGLDLGGNGSLSGDANGDGRPNFLAFALNGNPLTSLGSNKIAATIEQVAGEDSLTITLPVRGNDTPFSGSTELVSSPVDGIIYRIQGSQDLADFSSKSIQEVVPALTGELPALEAGWQYRTFRLAEDIGSNTAGFLRASIEVSP